MDIPAWFDWEVKLIDTKDSVITLHLHLDGMTTNWILQDIDGLVLKVT